MDLIEYWLSIWYLIKDWANISYNPDSKISYYQFKDNFEAFKKNNNAR